MPTSIETIKVIIRFKGNELIPKDEVGLWKHNPKCNMIVAPTLADTPINSEKENGGKFVFDNVLKEASQEEMYDVSAKQTVA